MKDLAVSGRDLTEAGMKPGKELGDMLRYLLEIVLEDPERNQKEQLLAEFYRKLEVNENILS